LVYLLGIPLNVFLRVIGEGPVGVFGVPLKEPDILLSTGGDVTSSLLSKSNPPLVSDPGVLTPETLVVGETAVAGDVGLLLLLLAVSPGLSLTRLASNRLEVKGG